MPGDTTPQDRTIDAVGLRLHLWPAVRQIKAPTLILRGSESDVFSPDTAKRMHDLIPESRLVEIPGTGHSVPAEAPEAFERAVREFLGM